MKKLKSSWLVILAYASLAISILSIFTSLNINFNTPQAHIDVKFVDYKNFKNVL